VYPYRDEYHNEADDQSETGSKTEEFSDGPGTAVLNNTHTPMNRNRKAEKRSKSGSPPSEIATIEISNINRIDEVHYAAAG